MRYQRSKSDRRGAILVLFLVLFPVLLLIVGFSVDYAQMQRSRTELRRATDLAAKAAAVSLAQTADETIALQVAKDIASENFVAGDPLQLADADVTFGTSSRMKMELTGLKPAASLQIRFGSSGIEQRNPPAVRSRPTSARSTTHRLLNRRWQLPLHL